MTGSAVVAEWNADAARAGCDALAGILHDCVEGGASVSFMWPFTIEEARSYWSGIVGALEAQRLRLFVASLDGAPGGTVQMWLDGPCNQKHRADIRKLLVHRAFRRRRLARLLMAHAEKEAVGMGLSLLTLDTVTASPAERLYESLGWSIAGVIPAYAKWPDGRFCDATMMYRSII